ncbi:hypothetical protein STXM2123_4133 [Streptomyces sp. F-3]|nr:hypothetical protein STXM2123_4133 [Streptomyces sp. F-3]
MPPVVSRHLLVAHRPGLIDAEYGLGHVSSLCAAVGGTRRPRPGCFS